MTNVDAASSPRQDDEEEVPNSPRDDVPDGRHVPRARFLHLLHLRHGGSQGAQGRSPECRRCGRKGRAHRHHHQGG